MEDKMLSSNELKRYVNERKKVASRMLLGNSITIRSLATHSINWANDILYRIEDGTFDWEDE